MSRFQRIAADAATSIAANKSRTFLMLLGLGLVVVRLRRKHGVLTGDGGHATLARAMRVQANLPQLLQALTGASTQSRAMVSPTLQAQVVAPDVRCHQVRVTT